MDVESHGEITETTSPTTDTSAGSSGGMDMAGAVDSIGADLGFGSSDDADTTEAVDKTPAPVAPTTDPTPASDPATPPAPAASTTPAPRTWRPEAVAEWDKLPPTVQAEVLKREEDMFKGIEGYKADATLGKTMQAVLKPFEQVMQQHGVNAPQQIHNLLQAHYTLAMGTPEQKMAIFQRIVEDYGLENLSATPAQLDPTVRALQSQVQSLTSSLQGFQQQREGEVRSTLAKELDAFSKDPANADFDLVATDIASLLQSGQAQSLREAYDKAVWLNPAARAKQIERETTARAAAAKKAADIKAAEVRKATAANVKASAKSASAATPLGSMDDSLEATLAAIKARG